MVNIVLFYFNHLTWLLKTLFTTSQSHTFIQALLLLFLYLSTLFNIPAHSYTSVASWVIQGSLSCAGILRHGDWNSLLYFLRYVCASMWERERERLMFWLTFHHDHVHVYSADVGLWQTFALLQQTRHFLRWHGCIWLCPKWHHLPHCHPCPGKEDNLNAPRQNSQTVTFQEEG